MLGSQSTQASSERSRPRSRLLMMKERLQIQRQRSHQQSAGNCQHDDAEGRSKSVASESLPSADGVEAPQSSQPPVKGRRFQRSRHAEQQARSRSQDAVASGAKKDGFFGCASSSRPLQKSKSVDMNLEKIVPAARRSNTVSVDVENVATAGGRKPERKGSFLFRSSSLLARLSGRSGQKKLRSPLPLRRDGSRSQNADDSVASADQSAASSTMASFLVAEHLENLKSSDSAEIEGVASQQQLRAVAACICRPAVAQGHVEQSSDKGSVSGAQSTNDRRMCRCSADVGSCHVPVSRPPRRCRENAAALEHGSEIVQAAEMRRGLTRQVSEDLAGTDGRGGQLQPLPAGESQTARKIGAGGRRVSTSAGNLLNRTTRARQDPASTGSTLNGRVEALTASSVAALSACDHASLDAVAVTTTSADERHGEYRFMSGCSRLSVVVMATAGRLAHQPIVVSESGQLSELDATGPECYTR